MYSKVPEPKFNINEWFKESFPKPELYVPEPPNIESQNELHIKMYQQQLKQNPEIYISPRKRVSQK